MHQARRRLFNQLGNGLGRNVGDGKAGAAGGNNEVNGAAPLHVCVGPLLNLLANGRDLV